MEHLNHWILIKYAPGGLGEGANKFNIFPWIPCEIFIYFSTVIHSRHRYTHSYFFYGFNYMRGSRGGSRVVWTHSDQIVVTEYVTDPWRSHGIKLPELPLGSRNSSRPQVLLCGKISTGLSGFEFNRFPKLSGTYLWRLPSISRQVVHTSGNSLQYRDCWCLWNQDCWCLCHVKLVSW